LSLDYSWRRVPGVLSACELEQQRKNADVIGERDARRVPTCQGREYWKNSALSRPSPPVPVVPPLVRASKRLLQELKALPLQHIPVDQRRGSAGRRMTCLGRRFEEGWWRLLDLGLKNEAGENEEETGTNIGAWAWVLLISWRRF
jgi:hypothetical protein